MINSGDEEDRRTSRNSRQDGGCLRRELLMNARAGGWRLVEEQDIG